MNNFLFTLYCHYDDNHCEKSKLSVERPKLSNRQSKLSIRGGPNCRFVVVSIVILPTVWGVVVTMLVKITAQKVSKKSKLSIAMTMTMIMNRQLGGG